ncbi:hypothetical protein [Variovorax boronicumulans]
MVPEALEEEEGEEEAACIRAEVSRIWARGDSAPWFIYQSNDLFN